MRTDPLPEFLDPIPASPPPRKRRGTVRWIVLASLAGIASLGYLRETGQVDLGTYQTKTSVSSSHSPLNLQHVEGARATGALRESEEGSWTVELDSAAGPVTLTIQADIGEITGTYWTPFYKRGSCRYEFGVTCPELGLRERGGAGTIDLEVRGVASVHEFRAELRAVVAAAIESWLDELKT